MNENYTAYCFRCKAKRDVKSPELYAMKNGMKAIKGVCSECGGKVFKILPKEKKEN